jgi:hypothetical protein
MPIVPLSVPAPAGFTDCVWRRSPLHPGLIVILRTRFATGKIMRAEIERLVEEIKQSVGLLRRHL